MSAALCTSAAMEISICRLSCPRSELGRVFQYENSQCPHLHQGRRALAEYGGCMTATTPVRGRFRPADITLFPALAAVSEAVITM